MFADPELRKIHPLGKSPVITLKPQGIAEPIVLAETGFIAQYLTEHFGKDTTLLPQRYKPGHEGEVGFETDEWLRYTYLLHYNEGSLMTTLMISAVAMRLKSSSVPFLVRPLTSLVANQVLSMLVFPNTKRHLEFLEELLQSSGGDYLCGKHLTAADIVVSFALITAKDGFKDFGNWEKPLDELFPKLWGWAAKMENSEGYMKSVRKIKEIDDSFGIKFGFE
jgi:glutathione S-transferase